MWVRHPCELKPPLVDREHLEGESRQQDASRPGPPDVSRETGSTPVVARVVRASKHFAKRAAPAGTGAVRPRQAWRLGSGVPIVVAGTVIGVAAGWIAAPGRATAAIGPVVAVTGAGVAVWDITQRRIPTRLLVVAAAAVVTVGVLVAVVDHRVVGWSVVSGAALGGVPLLIVHLVTPQGIGFGDVRYGFVVGGSLGVVHWSLAAWMLLVAAIAAVVAVMALPGRRRSVPFGAFLAGAGVAVLSSARALL